MIRRLAIFTIAILYSCLTGLSSQAAVFTDTTQANRLLKLSQQEKDTKQAITYALQSLSIGARLNDHRVMAKSYRQLNYLYTPERSARLLEADSLWMVHAGQSGDETLYFDAVQTVVKNRLNIGQIARAEKHLPALDSLSNSGDTLFRKCVYSQVLSFYHFKRFRPVESQKEAWKYLGYAYQLKNTLLIGRALYDVGMGYTYRFKNDSAAIYLFKSLDELKKINNHFEIGQVYSNLGLLYHVTGNVPKAIAHYEQSYAAYIRAEAPLDAAYVHIVMSDIYLNLHKNDSALICVNRALKTFKKLNYAQGLGAAYANLGRCYARIHLPDSSNHYFALSKEVLKNTSSIMQFYAGVHETIGAIENKDYGKADTLIRQYAKKTHETVSKELLVGVTNKLAMPNYTDQAKQRLQQVLLKGDTGLIMSDTMNINGMTGTLIALDSLIIMKQQQQVAQLETIYKVKEAQDSTKLAQQQILLAKQQINQRNLILLFTFLLLGISGLLLYVQVKNRQRAQAEKQRALEDKTTIEHLKEELDHRVGNTLNNISFIISLVKSRSTDQRTFALLEEKIDPLMVLYRMLSERSTEDVALQEYFEKICQGLKASYDHDDNVILHIEAPVTMGGSKAGKVGLILNELVTNSFKYAFQTAGTGHIYVRCTINDQDEYCLTISDSGPGMQHTQPRGTQKGLQLVQALAYQLKASIKQHQAAGAGFEFYFL